MKLTRFLAAAGIAAILASPAHAAGGKASTFENALLKLIFNATALGQLADNTATTPATTLCVALHTADPGASGTATTSEAAYTSYARVSVARTTSGWTVSTNTVAPVAAITFAAATGGSETETYWSVSLPTTGGACTGSQTILYRGPITPNLAVSSGVTPQLTTSSMVTEN